MNLNLSDTIQIIAAFYFAGAWLFTVWLLYWALIHYIHTGWLYTPNPLKLFLMVVFYPITLLIALKAEYKERCNPNVPHN